MRRILLILAVAAGLIPVGATAAHADQLVHGYVLANQPNTANYIVNNAFKYNSTGGVIEITRTAAGRYTVRFAGMGTSGGAAHVQTYGSPAASVCNVTSWGPSLLAPSDLFVYVRCFNSAGALTDSRFVADFTNQTASEGRFAYLWADKPNNVIPYNPSASYSYDDTGAAPIVDPDGVGRYIIYFNTWLELDEADHDAVDAGHFQVTAYNSGAVWCKVGYDDDVEGPTQLSVLCQDKDGEPVNSKFVITYSYQVSQLGTDDPHGTAIVGHNVLLDDDVDVFDWWSTTDEEPTVTNPGTGVYQVRFPGLSTLGGFAIASAVAHFDYCYVHSWLSALGGDQVVNVRCYDIATGLPSESAFHVTVMH